MTLKFTPIEGDPTPDSNQEQVVKPKRLTKSERETLLARITELEALLTGSTNEKNELRSALRRARLDMHDEAKIRSEIFKIAGVSPNPPSWLMPQGKKGKFGVPMSLWSDWHCGEVVNKQEVGGVNEFNTQICRARADRLVSNIIDICFNHMQDASYPGIVICLGGDMVTGDIHEELADTNDRYILQTIQDLLDILVSGLTRLAIAFGNVFVPCVPGNHGRQTKKMRAKGRQYTSYEWLLYCLLERHFANDKRVKFYIPPETDAHFSVAGHRFLLTHGDMLGVKGGDGIIGALGPIMRGAIKTNRAESQVNRNYDTMLIGHYHQYISLMGITVNGCFVPGTLVQTPSGVRQIEKLKEGDVVLSRDGTWQNVTHKFIKKSTAGLVSLKIRGLPELLTTTPNHEIWAIKAESPLSRVEPKWRENLKGGDKPKWIPADFLSPGDWVHIPRHVGKEKPFSEKLAWVYGLFLAEGHTIVDGGASKKHNRIEISSHMRELPWLEEAKKILIKELPHLCNKESVRIWTRPDRTTSHLSVSGKDIAVMFRDMFGHLCYNKKIPDSFRELTPKLAAAVVQGWIDGDGHTAKQKDGFEVTSATTVSRQLAYDMFGLALTAGMRPSLAKLSKGGPRKNDSYTIHFNAGQESQEVNGELFYRVHHRFRNNKVTKVYDLEVSGEHTYNAGLVGVHNSLKGFDEYARLFLRVPYQPPIQAMWFVHPAKGVTCNLPIYLEDQYEGKNEGWVQWDPTNKTN